MAAGARRRETIRRDSCTRRTSGSTVLVSFLVVLLLGHGALRSCHGLATTAASQQQPVSKLLLQYADEIAQLEAIAASNGGAAVGSNKVFYLRYCLDSDDPQSRRDKLKEALEWRRKGPGQSICRSARDAVIEAAKQSDGGKWNNAAVLDAAPHASLIKPYLTPSQVLTTSLPNGDLLYCIRAGLINDNELLSRVSIDQLVEFFLYVKEVHSLVADDRSVEQDRLVTVVTANDLTNVPLIGGSADFRQALSQSSKIATQLYPSLAGPTLLLNLPKLLAALVKLFTPLFPPAVNERLRFAQAPCLASVKTLLDVTVGGSQRGALVAEIQSILGTAN